MKHVGFTVEMTYLRAIGLAAICLQCFRANWNALAEYWCKQPTLLPSCNQPSEFLKLPSRRVPLDFKPEIWPGVYSFKVADYLLFDSYRGARINE